MTLHAKYEIEHGPIRKIDYMNGGERDSVRIILKDSESIPTVREALNSLRIEFMFASENGMDFFEIQKPEMAGFARNLKKIGLVTSEEMLEIQRDFLKIRGKF